MHRGDSMIKEEVEEEYFNWLCGIVCGDRFSSEVSFDRLLRFLHDTIFTYMLKKDKNRAEDGKQLRYRFAVSCDKPELEDYLTGGCTVLEMMVALAIRCEEDFMDDPTMGNRTAQWFWMMITNLGLGGMMDESFDESKARRVINRFLNREYEPDGRGGLFRIKNCKRDLTDVEIWFQLCFYLDTIT